MALASAMSDPEAQRFVRDPRVSDTQLVEVLNSVGGGQFSAPVSNFVKTLVAAGRTEALGDISDLFEHHRAEAAGVNAVQITAAFDLDESEKNKLAEAVRRRLGGDVDVDVTTDSSLIGGAVVRAGDTVMDLSVLGRLANLRNELTS